MSDQRPAEGASYVERLREGVTVLDEPFHHPALEEVMLEAADEIERLRAVMEEVITDIEGDIPQNGKKRLKAALRGEDAFWGTDRARR